MQNSAIESCLDKKFSDILSSFKTCSSSLLWLLMALWRSLLQIDEASLLETFGNLKIRNSRYTPSCLQLLRKSMPNFSLFPCASCSSSYIGETCCHFKTRIEEKDNKIKDIKRITSLIYLNMYTSSQQALTHAILFLLQQLIKLTLNST